MVLPLHPVAAHAAHAEPREPPYQWFLLTALVLAAAGGLAYAIAASLDGALEWGWGTRQPAMLQVHGQLQLIGFAGLFTAGMTLRLVPRISARPLRTPWLIWPTLVAIAASMILRAIAQPAPDAALRDVALGLSAGAFVVGAAAFAALVGVMTLHPAREATELFFALGALFLLASSGLNAVIVYEMLDEQAMLADSAKQSALVFIQQYGFIVMFLAGVASRALPTFSGLPRAEIGSRVTAVTLAAGVSMFAAGVLGAAYGEPGAGWSRLAAGGLIVVAGALAFVVWITGVLHPRANRIAPASRRQFWFVRSAMIWLLLGAALLAWYGVRALSDAALPDQFAIDAVRHLVALGVITMMIIGMAMLIVPEFAARRMHHPHDGPIVWAMLAAANAAVVLRVWPSLEGIDWIESTRYWPMAVAGLLAEGVLLAFALLFAQSWLERGGWRTPKA